MTTTSRSPAFWSWFQWLLFLIGSLFIIGALFSWQIYSSLHSFAQTAGVSANDIFQIYRASQHYPLKSHDQHINFLLLGVDTLPDRPADHPLTDTIILASLNLVNGQINLLTIPRDIYLPAIKNKINSIYAHYYLNQSAQALTLTTEFYAQTFDLPIHYTLLISLSDLHHFLTLIDGIEVDIVNSFTDHRYPRSEVDVTQVSAVSQLYESISFEQGLTKLDPDQTLKFIRSRHAEGIEGSDYARSARQQLVLEAILQKVIKILINQARTYDFTFLGELYQFYQTHYHQQIPFVEFLALGRLYLNEQFQFQLITHQLSIHPRDFPASLIENQGNYQTQGLWALMITDQDKLIEEIKIKLDLTSD